MGGGKTASTTPTRYAGIQVQTSISGRAIPWVWGTARVSTNMLWYGDFTSKAQKSSSSGKGGGGSTTSYTYSASLILGICKGPIAGVRQVYQDTTATTLSAAKMSLALGSIGQTPWSYLTSSHPSQAIGYSGLAYIYASNYPLSGEASAPNFSLEVQTNTRAVLGASTLDDAVPADIFTTLLGDFPYWQSSWLGDMSAYANYTLAQNLLLSPVLDSQTQASSFLTDILTASNSDAVWTDGKLNIVPLGDTTVSGNGTTYTPNLTPIYDLNDDDFVPGSQGDDPVVISINRDDDAYNYIQVEYLQRSNQYNTQVVPGIDAASIQTYGRRPNTSPYSLHCICDDTVAATVAQLIVQRTANVRRTFKFNLSWNYVLLEPLDLVTLTTGVASDGGLVRTLVRITDIDESDEGMLQFTAEEVLVGSAHSPAITRQPAAGYAGNYQVDPGNCNAPLIVNPPRALTSGALEAWIALSGGPNWGGAEVWVSYDNTTYALLGTIDGSSRYGVTTTDLPAPTGDPDTAHTLGVNLSESGGIIDGGSTTDADNHTTLALVGTEILAYSSATLTGTSTYSLGAYLRRGLYGTTAADQPSGSEFLRIDGTPFAFSYRDDQVGKTVYVKFRSFNIFGNNLQDLSTLSAYTFVLNPSEAAFTLVNWSEVGGTGKPADNATVGATTGTNLFSGGSLGVLGDTGSYGIVTSLTTAAGITGQGGLATSNLYVQAVAPTSPNNGDLWLDLSTSPYTWRVRNGGAWRAGAVAVYGSSLPSGYTPGEGDEWINTSYTPVVLQRYTSGAWVTISTVGATTGSNLYSALRGVLADSGAQGIITSLNVASAITGQGSLATANSVAYGTGQVSGFGQMAALSSAAYGSLYLTGFGSLAALSNALGLTAGGITSQGPWATWGGSVSDVYFARPNLVINPTWAQGISWWTYPSGNSSPNGCVSGPIAGQGYVLFAYTPNAQRVYATQDVTVTPGVSYSLQGRFYTNGVASNCAARIYIEWLTSAKAHIAYSTTINSYGEAWVDHQLANLIAPSTAAYARIVLDTVANSGSWSNSDNICWSRVKLEQGPTCTPYTDNVTNGALSSSLFSTAYGMLGDTGSNGIITSLTTASAIAGQGSLATANSVAYGTGQVSGFGSMAGISSAAYGSSYLTGFGALAPLGSVYYGSPYITETSGGSQATLANFKTSLGIASGFTGQATIATTGAWANLSGVPGTGDNLLVNGDFKLGAMGWATAGSNTVNQPAGAGYMPTMQIYTASIANGSTFDGACTKGFWLETFAPNNWLIPITGGVDTVYVSAMMGQRNCTAQIYLLFYDGTGTLTEAPAFSGAKDYSTDSYVGNGDPAHYNTVSAVYKSTSASTRWCGVLLRLANSSGATQSNCYGWFSRVAAGKLASGMTAAPSYAPGYPEVAGQNNKLGSGYTYNPASPVSTVSSSAIAMQATTVSNAALTITTSAANITGLSASTAYAVFWDTWTSTYTAVSSGLTAYMNSFSRYVFMCYATTGASGGSGSGGSGGGGFCPAPETLVTLSSGLQVPASELAPGDAVLTQHEVDQAWTQALVTHVQRVENQARTRLVMEDGRTIVCSPLHQMLIGPSEWMAVADMRPGQPIMGSRPGRVLRTEQAEDGPVMKISVEGARTYQTEGLVSHNNKPAA